MHENNYNKYLKYFSDTRVVKRKQTGGCLPGIITGNHTSICGYSNWLLGYVFMTPGVVTLQYAIFGNAKYFGWKRCTAAEKDTINEQNDEVWSVNVAEWHKKVDEWIATNHTIEIAKITACKINDGMFTIKYEDSNARASQVNIKTTEVTATEETPTAKIVTIDTCYLYRYFKNIDKLKEELPEECLPDGLHEFETQP